MGVLALQFRAPPLELTMQFDVIDGYQRAGYQNESDAAQQQSFPFEA